MVKPGAPAEHLAKAGGFLAAAGVLLHAGLPERAVSDGYFAVFHVAQALVAQAGIVAETHAGVLAQLGRRYVEDGPLPPGISRDMSHLLTDRLLADYGVDRQIDDASAADSLRVAIRVIRPTLGDALEAALEAR